MKKIFILLLILAGCTKQPVTVYKSSATKQLTVTIILNSKYSDSLYYAMGGTAAPSGSGITIVSGYTFDTVTKWTFTVTDPGKDSGYFTYNYHSRFPTDTLTVFYYLNGTLKYKIVSSPENSGILNY